MGYCQSDSFMGGDIMWNPDAADGLQFYYTNPVLDDAVYAGDLEALLPLVQLALIEYFNGQIANVLAATTLVSDE